MNRWWEPLAALSAEFHRLTCVPPLLAVSRRTKIHSNCRKSRQLQPEDEDERAEESQFPAKVDVTGDSDALADKTTREAGQHTNSIEELCRTCRGISSSGRQRSCSSRIRTCAGGSSAPAPPRCSNLPAIPSTWGSFRPDALYFPPGAEHRLPFRRNCH